MSRHPSLHRSIALLLLLAGLLAGAAAPAQTPPDAGALRQQLDRAREPALPARGEPPAAQAELPLRMPQGGALTVQAFRFTGATLLAEPQLQAAVQPWRGRPVGFADLQQAAQAVARAYRDAGWIVRTLLPLQDVTDGQVTIAVIEAVYGGAHLAEPAPSRVAPEIVLAHANARQAVGAPLQADALDRGLLLADDLPGVALAGTLEPGAADGETALRLAARDEPLLSGEVGLDNGGARATGAERMTLSLRVASPLQRGDQARAELMASRGVRYAQFGYSLPIGADGLRLGVVLSAFDYRLVGADFEPLGGEGGTGSAGIDLRYPLLRSRLANVYVSAALDHKRYRNRAADALQSRYRVDALTLGLAGNRFDAAGGNASSAALSWSRGNVDLGHLDPGETRARDGGFGRWRYNLSHQQALPGPLTLYGALAGQHADRTLDSSERFYLGGPGGVRAYPVNEGSGSRGTLANLELRWQALPALTATLFYDWGHASGGTPATTLKGYGASLAWAAPAGIDLRAVLARRDGRNPHPTASGRDQDGSLHRHRLWLQASLAF